MHQSFVTTTPMGPENSADIDFAKPGYMPSTAGTFLWSKPCKKTSSNPRVQMWNYLGRLGMRIKAPLPMFVVPRHCGDDAEDKTWHVAYYRLATSLIIKLFFTVHFYNTCFFFFVFFSYFMVQFLASLSMYFSSLVLSEYQKSAPCL